MYSAWFDASVSLQKRKCAISGIIKLGDKRIMEYSKKVKFTGSNNRVEYLALVKLLKRLVKLNINEVIVHGDNKNVIENVNGMNRFRDKKTQELSNDAKILLTKINKCEVKWIPRKDNTVADKLLDKVMSK